MDGLFGRCVSCGRARVSVGAGQVGKRGCMRATCGDTVGTSGTARLTGLRPVVLRESCGVSTATTGVRGCSCEHRRAERMRWWKRSVCYARRMLSAS